MKVGNLASYIAKHEGKKSSVTIGDIREVLSILSEILYQEKDFDKTVQSYTQLLSNGRRRISRKKNK